MANYTPRQVDPSHWVAVRGFVREAVVESAPPTADEARRRMTLVSALADWVGYDARLPVERRTVFDLDVMGEFVDSGNDWTPKVRRMARGRLRGMAQRLNPDWPSDLPDEGAYSSAWDPQPYSDAETAALRRWARGQATAGRGADAEVLLALTLGAGLHAHEVVALRVRDVEADHAGVLLRVRGQQAREVPVHATRERVLLALLRDAPGGRYAFRPDSGGRGSALVSALVAQSDPQPHVRPTARRMRATWVVTHLTAGVAPGRATRSRTRRFGRGPQARRSRTPARRPCRAAGWTCARPAPTLRRCLAHASGSLVVERRGVPVPVVGSTRRSAAGRGGSVPTVCRGFRIATLRLLRRPLHGRADRGRVV